MNNKNIKIIHKGEDYYGIEIDGVYREFDFNIGEAIKGLIEAKKEIDKILKTLTK